MTTQFNSDIRYESHITNPYTWKDAAIFVGIMVVQILAVMIMI